HRREDMIPGRPERFGNLLPAQTLGPARQKPGVGLRQLVFPRHPGHLFHPNATTGTIHPARCIDEKHLNTPHRNKFKAAHRQPVIAGPSTLAARANCPTIRPRPQFRLYGQFVGVFHPTHSAIHKRLEILHAVKDSLEVHPVLSPLSDIRSHLYPYRVGGQDAPLPVNPLLAELQPIPGYGLPTNFPEEPKNFICPFITKYPPTGTKRNTIIFPIISYPLNTK